MLHGTLLVEEVLRSGGERLSICGRRREEIITHELRTDLNLNIAMQQRNTNNSDFEELSRSGQAREFEISRCKEMRGRPSSRVIENGQEGRTGEGKMSVCWRRR